MPFNVDPNDPNLFENLDFKQFPRDDFSFSPSAFDDQADRQSPQNLSTDYTSVRSQQPDLQANANVNQFAPATQQHMDGLTRLYTSGVLCPEGDEYLPFEIDEAGERKVSPTGEALEGREFRIRTFRLFPQGSEEVHACNRMCKGAELPRLLPTVQ